MSERDNLPNGADLANALGDLFKSGDLNDLLDVPKPEILKPAEEEKMKQNIDRHMEDFVNNLFQALSFMVDNRREAAKAIRQVFGDWKQKTYTNLKFRGTTQEAQSVYELTLKDISIFTQKRLKELEKDAGTALPGSPEQQRARVKADSWSKMEEIITPAADPD